MEVSKMIGYGFYYMILFQSLFFIFTIGLILWTIKNYKGEDTKDILNKRLVMGEITKKEYNEIMKTIEIE